MKSKVVTSILLSTIIALASLFSTAVLSASAVTPTLLDPLTIPKFVNQLVIPPVHVPTNVEYDAFGNAIREDYTIWMNEFYEPILGSGYPMTKVWGYGGLAKDALTGQFLGFFQHSPSSTFEATRGIPVQVTWINNITSPHQFPVDPTLHWADPNMMGGHMELEPPFEPFPPGYPDAQYPVPLVTHLHGGEDRSTSDGHPEAWYTYNGLQGQHYNTEAPIADNAAVFYYPNEQLPTTLWYHDHGLGVTRINVMSGLAGFYLLRDMADKIAPKLPKGEFEVPIVIQDRIFTTDGQMFYPSDGVNPDVHPYWQPEFFGDTIMVNGRVWPNFDVSRGWYRFRLLDGSNARFYTLSFVTDYGLPTETALPFYQIGSDGGYLKSAAMLTSLTFAPGERADILIDFSGLAPGTKVIMKNTANAPFPGGDPVDPDTTGQIMQFTARKAYGYRPRTIQYIINPATILNPTLAAGFPSLSVPILNRTLPFFEEMSAIDEPLGVFLNGQMWHDSITEFPMVGSTEDWWLTNPTEDAHPIHTHLTQFQLVYRWEFNATAYTEDWIALNGEPPVNPDGPPPTELPVYALNPDGTYKYLIGDPILPTPQEMGWKDTIIADPGFVTAIRIRWAPQDADPAIDWTGTNLYAFDPTYGPGYVWHCHILEHEDNEMMRPYEVVP